MRFWWMTKLLAAIALGLLGVCGVKWAACKAREAFAHLRVMPLCAVAALIVGGAICTVEAQKRGVPDESAKVESSVQASLVSDSLEVQAYSVSDSLGARASSPATHPDVSGRDARSPISAPLRQLATGYTVTTSDIERGWRVESVATNDVFGYQREYSNRIDNAEWHQRGGRRMRCCVDFGDWRT